MKTSLRLLLILTISLISLGCPKWEADFYIGDSMNQQIVNSEGETISCSDPKFDEFGCLHQERIIELKKWIDRNCR